MGELGTSVEAENTLGTETEAHSPTTLVSRLCSAVQRRWKPERCDGDGWSAWPTWPPVLTTERALLTRLKEQIKKAKIINLLSLKVEVKTSLLLNECSNQLSYESLDA